MDETDWLLGDGLVWHGDLSNAGLRSLIDRVYWLSNSTRLGLEEILDLSWGLDAETLDGVLDGTLLHFLRHLLLNSGPFGVGRIGDGQEGN